MPRTRTLLVWLVLVLPSLPAAAADGFELYAQHCAKCHGKGGHADTWRGRFLFAANLAKPSFQAGVGNDELLAAINRGPGMMPAFEKTLSLEDRKALVQVIRSFSAGIDTGGCCGKRGD